MARLDPRLNPKELKSFAILEHFDKMKYMYAKQLIMEISKLVFIILFYFFRKSYIIKYENLTFEQFFEKHGH